MIIKKKIQKPAGEIQNNTVTPEKVENVEVKNEESIDLFNLDNIDFKQRMERRKGDRRRGFRRTDDRNLISRAREEAQSIREAASKEGYQAGLAQAADAIEEVKNSITSFLGAKQEVFDYIAPNIMEISLDIAKKIIKREIQQDPSIILDNIAEVLKGLSKMEVPSLISDNGLEAKVLIVPDENIMEGGCVVETANGVVDAAIETQLAVISEALKGI